VRVPEGEVKSREDELSREIVGAAIEVHRELGPGLLESVYQTCLAHEMILRGITIEVEKPLPVTYKGIHLDAGYRVDLLVEEKVVVEVKAVDDLAAIHEAQVMTYLRIGGYKLGMLINFGKPVLREGIKRIVMGL